MRKWITVAVACIVLQFGSMSARADLVLSFASDAPDPSDLAVGQVVTFSVLVSGLGGAGNPSALSELGIDVSYDGTLLGPPTVAAGAIVPDPSSASFTPIEISGSAGAVYDTIFSGAPNITSDGVFFTFSVVALATGSGTLTFDPAPSGFDDNNDLAPLDSTATYAFRIRAVPEPSSFAMLGGAGVLLGARRFLRRRTLHRAEA